MNHVLIFTMVAYFLRWTLLIYFSSIPDEQSQQKVRQLGRITRAVINTSNEVKYRLLWEFLIYNFSRRILERVFVGSIVNIRNECLFVWVHGEWIVTRNKQSSENRFAVHAICLSRATIHSPWTLKTDTHPLIGAKLQLINMLYLCIIISHYLWYFNCKSLSSFFWC